MMVNTGSYFTNYISNGNEHINSVCFSVAFKSEEFKPESNYKILICKSPVGTKNHTLLFNEEEINVHLSQLKKVIPTLEYSIKSINAFNLGDCFEISLDLKDEYKLAHKYALTWVRYLYEYPYNLILKEVYRLKNSINPFKRQNISNLYMLVSTAFPEIPSSGHSVNHSGYFIPLKTLRKRLTTNKYLNDLYDPVNYEDYEKFDLKLSRKLPYRDTEYWENEENFNNRISHYKKVLQFLKGKKQ